MKTRCPNCHTSFRVTTDQIRARVGKVRCGQCQTVFNALDSLLEDTAKPGPYPPLHVPSPTVPPPPAPTASPSPAASPPFGPVPAATTPPLKQATPDPSEVPQALDFELAPIEIDAVPDTQPPPQAAADAAVASAAAEPPPFEVDEARETRDGVHDDSEALSEREARELGRRTGLILPRETTKIPGYSKWTDGVMAAPLALPGEKPTRWPFAIVALILLLVLAGQVVFRFRSELAVTMPALRPALAAFVSVFDADIPLPRHVELVSIEASDLQKDAARGNLLILNATVRNRAAYGQAYPSLELSLTDTQDAAIARRVFSPAEYLSPKLSPAQPFAGNSDLAVRLWIDARDIAAAGYRLYVFYP